MRHGPEALLCERCGYHLRGLTREDSCPECGKQILESLYSSRTGTRWQRNRTWRSWWATTLEMVRHPHTFWDQIEFGDGSATPRSTNLLVCFAIVCILPGLTGLSILLMSRLEMISFLRAWVLYMILAALVIVGCMWIEVRGCMVIARVHGWRAPRAAIKMLVDHASVGWCVGGIWLSGLAFLTWLAGDVLGLEVNPTPYRDMFGFVLVSPILFGLVSFETLVYFGLRRLKYANMPGSERELAEASGGGAAGTAIERGKGEQPADSSG